MKAILRVLLIAGGVLLLTLSSLGLVRQMSQAQSGADIIITKVLNRPSNVVRVGDILTFTILVTNNPANSFTLTNVTLVDTFDDTILQFNQAIPPQDFLSGGVISWSNVAVLQNPAGMLPGDVVTLTVSFRAIRPRTAIVNRVEGRDIIREGNQNGIDGNNQASGDEAVPARAPVYKVTSPPGAIPQAGLPITFTHLITNDSGAFLTYLPLTDTYESAFLQFNFAIPPPDVITPPGTLVWTNLADPAYFGPITPDTTLVITTVFTATTQVVSTTNRASTEGAIDEFGNDATGGLAEAPITIIEDNPTPTPTTPSDDNDNDDDSDTPAPTSTALMVATPAPTVITPAVATQTPATGPIYLPETGYMGRPGQIGAILAGMIVIALAWYLKGKL
jgi:uncharacterized repeat protein (TIGR01451 family)